MKIADRTKDVKYAIRDLVVEAQKIEKQGKKILYLNIGDPNVYDFQTPAHIRKALSDSLDKAGSYADSMGVKEARQALENEAKRKGVEANEENILIFTGGSEAINFSMGALVNPGDNVLTPTPGYPLFNSMLKYYGAEDREYYLDEENNWEPNVDDIRKKIDDKTKAVIIINPNNPTGNLYSKKVLKEITDLAGEHNLLILSDETYDKLLLDGEEHVATASLAKDIPIATLGSISKNYLCPGWRVGWLMFTGEGIGDYREAIAKLARARLSAPHPQQVALVSALEGSQEHLKDTIKRLRERRDFTYKRMNEIENVSLVKPTAAFYAFPKLHLEMDSDEKFIIDLLRKENVLFVHGTGFGNLNGNHFRMVFLPPVEILEDAFNRLDRFIRSYK